MALPSQYSRIGPGRVTASRKPARHAGRSLGVLVGLAVIVVIVVLAVRSRTGTPEAPASAEAAGTPPRETGPEPVRLSMGNGVQQTSSPRSPTPGAAMPPDSPTSAQQSPAEDAVQTRVLPGSAEEGADAPESRAEIQAIGPAQRALAAADECLGSNDPLGARATLNAALRDATLTAQEQALIREKLTEINADLLFSPRIVTGDPLVGTHTIRSDDYLSTLPAKLDLAIDWRLLGRVNRIPNPNNVGLGQTLKIIYGPFHAVVHKAQFRLDVFVGPPGDPEHWTFVRSFPVGLGEGNGTPTGEFVVKKDSKLINPAWKNPRTSEQFAPDDPNNPIGEHWIGLRGVGESVAQIGYGIHGTIEPESIGRQMSMGCVRMREDDVAILYELLVEDVSQVRIVP